MASNPPGKCCAQGFKLTGSPAGKLIQTGNVESYAAGDSSSSRLLVIFTDVFGHKFNNIQLIADKYAAEGGYYVLIPDILKDDPTPFPAPEGWNILNDWFPRHVPEITQPIVDGFLDYVHKELKPKFIAATGYCFGAKYAVRSLGSKKVNAAALAHPSFVDMEEIEKLDSTTPLFISACETDSIYTEELRHKTEAKLKERKVVYHTTLASGCEHGFACRGDTSNPVVKFAMEKVYCDWFQWFDFCEKNFN